LNDIIASPSLSVCEVLTLDEDGERWEPLPPMHEARRWPVCAAIGCCVIDAGCWRESCIKLLVRFSVLVLFFLREVLSTRTSNVPLVRNILW
jgi:hypothetical protein